jgi:hypothetical protein
MFGPQVMVFALIAFIVAVIFFALWIIPMFRNSPTARTNYALVHRGKMLGKGTQLSWFQTARYKLVGMKQKLFSAFVLMAGVVIYLYDNWSPVFGNIDYQPIMSKLGNNGALFVNVAVTLVLLMFRKLSDNRPTK